MQAAAASMTENRIQGREAVEGFVTTRLKRGRIRDVSREDKYRTTAGTFQSLRVWLAASSGLISSRMRVRAGLYQFADHGFSDGAESAGDQDRFAGQVDGDHWVVMTRC